MQDMRNQKIENKELYSEHREQSKEKRNRLQWRLSVCFILLSLLIAPLSWVGLTSCSEWNTDTLGHKFVPANSQVHVYTHPVYVEYSTNGVRVWGPYTSEIESHIDGLQVTITNEQSDSLAIFAYGFPALQDTLGVATSSLKVNSSRPYALYLNGLSLRSNDQPVIESTGGEICHVVLTAKSRNTLFGSLRFAGEVSLSGTGSLNVTSRQSAIQAASLQCQYGVNVKLHSQESHGIDLSHKAMRSTLGTWYIDAALSAIHCPDTLLLLGGTYQGTALRGPYFSSPTILRRPLLLTAAAQQSHVIDSAFVALRYDSVQAVWQQHVDTLTLQADSLYQVFRNGSKSATLKFTPVQTIEHPYMLISQSTILSSDSLQFVHTVQKKK